MSNRWPGGIIRKTPVTPAGPAQNGAASGVWSLADAAYWTKQGLWPIAGFIPDGTFAIMALGNTNGGSVVRNKYTYSGCVVSAATAATAVSSCGSATGNSTVGIFAVASGSTARNKYTYVGCVVSAGGAATQALCGGSAVGNSTVGIFALGGTQYYCPCFGAMIYCNSSTRNKYTYSGDVVASGASASQGTRGGSAAGTATVGIFALGAPSSFYCQSYSTTRNKYTYSGDTNGSATAATASSRDTSAAGNSTFGIFALGCVSGVGQSTTRNKYTYSGDVVSAGGAATVASRRGSAAGNGAVGVFALGCIGSNSTTRNRYTYSGCVVAAGGAATVASQSGSAASNGISGITI
jgi:hypothetical protein